MPRRKPQVGWKLEHRTIELTDKQKAQLKRCGLPEIALPAIEEIARQAIAKASVKVPNRTEVHAALKNLRRKISAARTSIAQCDEWTAKHIDVAHYRLLKADGKMTRIPQPRADIICPAGDRLREMEAAIDAAGAALETMIVPRRAFLALHL